MRGGPNTYQTGGQLKKKERETGRKRKAYVLDTKNRLERKQFIVRHGYKSNSEIKLTKETKK